MGKVDSIVSTGVVDEQHCLVIPERLVASQEYLNLAVSQYRSSFSCVTDDTRFFVFFTDRQIIINARGRSFYER